MKSVKGVTVWNKRYRRNETLHVIVGKRDSERGHTNSFTLLFQNGFSFTFSMIDDSARAKILSDY